MENQEISVRSIRGIERPIEIECGSAYMRISIKEAKNLIKMLKSEIKFLEE